MHVFSDTPADSKRVIISLVTSMKPYWAKRPASYPRAARRADINRLGARPPLTRRNQGCRVDLDNADAARREQLMQGAEVDANPRLLRSEHRGELTR